MATTKITTEVTDLNAASSTSGLKMPTGGAYSGTPTQGMMRNDTAESSQGSASTMQHYNGTAWKNFENVAPTPTPPPAATDYFDIATYSGNGSTQSVTTSSGSFTPDLAWVKDRDNTNPYEIADSARGANSTINSNATNAEYVNSTYQFNSFNSGGFTVTDDAAGNYAINGSGINYVGWCWKAGASTSGSGVYYTNVTQRVNSSNGFSIVDFTMPVGSVPSNASYNHGLSQAPELVITKPYNGQYGTTGWYTYSSALGTTKYLSLHDTATAVTFSAFPTVDSTKVGYYFASNTSTASDVVTYNFHSVDSVQRIGSYTSLSGSSVQVYTDSNGDGTGTGAFQPRFVMLKLAVGGASAYTGWVMFDSSRDPNTTNDNPLYANKSQQEGLRGNGTGSAANVVDIQFNSSGFLVDPVPNNDGETNEGGGSTYIYLAIA